MDPSLVIAAALGLVGLCAVAIKLIDVRWGNPARGTADAQLRGELWTQLQAAQARIGELERELETCRDNGYRVRDFGYQMSSARYHGDHSPANNPDHDVDYDTPEHHEHAMENARRSHAIYMGQVPDKKEAKREGWMRFIPRKDMLPKKGKWMPW